jgi:hypothetical protein
VLPPLPGRWQRPVLLMNYYRMWTDADLRTAPGLVMAPPGRFPESARSETLDDVESVGIGPTTRCLQSTVASLGTCDPVVLVSPNRHHLFVDPPAGGDPAAKSHECGSHGGPSPNCPGNLGVSSPCDPRFTKEP